jgi:hypothetical protein
MLRITCLCRHEILRGNSRTPSYSLCSWTSYWNRPDTWNLVALVDVQFSLGRAVCQAVERWVLTFEAFGSVYGQPLCYLWRTEILRQVFLAGIFIFSECRHSTDAASVSLPELCCRPQTITVTRTFVFRRIYRWSATWLPSGWRWCLKLLLLNVEADVPECRKCTQH